MSSVNGFPIVSGSVALPRVGNWHADLLVNVEGLAKGTAVEVDMGDGVVLVGTVARGGTRRGVSKVRVVGGRGGLAKLARPKSYLSPLLRVVATDLMRDCGETLATLGSAGAHAIRPAWVTDRRASGEVLAALVAAAPAGTVWRVLADGGVWIGEETWPESTVDAVELEAAPDNDEALLGPFLPTLLPGTTYQGRQVDYVLHTFGNRTVKTRLLFRDEDRAASTDRVKDPLEALVRALAPGAFHARWRYRVVKQSGGYLDCVPDPQLDLPNLTNVPIKHGVPGLTISLQPGAFVMVGFENGDRRRPFVSEWDAGASVIELVLNGAQVIVGGTALAEPTLRGTTYRTAEDTYLAAIVTGVQACLGSLGKIPESQALAAAATAWSAASKAFLTTNTKVK